MTKYGITGMSCAACSARIEKVVGRIPGVKTCSVSLLTNSMVVEGDVDSKVIIDAVEGAGFKATLQADLEDKDTPVLKKRLILSIGFLVVLMYFSMGYTMLNFPLPRFIGSYGGRYLIVGIIQMVLAIAIMIINRKFFISGFKSALKLAPNMDTLVALSAVASFVWSIFNLVLMVLSELSGMREQSEMYLHDLYFESTGMILTLITVGKLLEARSKGRTTDAIKSLISLAPKQARILKATDAAEAANEIMVDITQVNPGDIFIVKSGESIPVDGMILEGCGTIDESSLTGESIPVDKITGDKVYCATIMNTGYLKCEATEVGADTTLSKIISTVAQASATKAPIARLADKVSGIFVPSVIIIAIITFTVWLIFGSDMSFALSRAISVLVISCPCALGLATPVAIMVGNGVSAKAGILFKTAEALENLGKITTAALDKTGTITKGFLHVTDVITIDETAEKELLETAYLLESRSEHPLARAVIKHCDGIETNLKLSDFAVETGYGVRGSLIIPTSEPETDESGEDIATYSGESGKKVYGGNLRYIRSIKDYEALPETEEITKRLATEGKTPLIFATDSKLLGVIAVADAIKEDSKAAIEEMKNLGIDAVMLTGDNRATAVNIAGHAGLSEDKVIADILPSDKAEKITDLKGRGLTAMVGDGINDAPALTAADIGIAIGAGAEIAIESADVVLMKDSLMDVVNAVKLSRATLRNIKQNLFWAFFYNVICIPLAAGVYYPLTGLTLNPMIGALAMSLSSFCVVSNALRLNLISKKIGVIK